jgi:hypothetical protein
LRGTEPKNQGLLYSRPFPGRFPADHPCLAPPTTDTFRLPNPGAQCPGDRAIIFGAIATTAADCVSSERLMVQHQTNGLRPPFPLRGHCWRSWPKSGTLAPLYCPRSGLCPHESPHESPYKGPYKGSANTAPSRLESGPTNGPQAYPLMVTRQSRNSCHLSARGTDLWRSGFARSG